MEAAFFRARVVGVVLLFAIASSACSGSDSEALSCEMPSSATGLVVQEPLQLDIGFGATGSAGFLAGLPSGCLIAGGLFQPLVVFAPGDVASAEVLPLRFDLVLDVEGFPDGRLLVEKGDAVVLDANGGRELQSIAVSATGNRLVDFEGALAVLSFESAIALWDPETGEKLDDLAEPLDGSGSFSDAILLTDGSLVTAANNGHVEVWAPGSASGRSLVSSAPPGSADALVDLGDGRVVISRSDYGLEIVDIDTPEDPVVLIGHRGRAMDMVLTEDGQLVSAGWTDGTVRVWDLEAGTSEVLVEHPGGVADLSTLGGGVVVSLGRDDGTYAVIKLEG